jgi:hypothetical protein
MDVDHGPRQHAAQVRSGWVGGQVDSSQHPPSLRACRGTFPRCAKSVRALSAARDTVDQDR